MTKKVRLFGGHLRTHFVAYLALFFALGGTSVAAVQALPRNSVGSPQLKNHSILKIDMNRKTVAALRGRRGARGPAGAVGATGATGARGATGPAGPAGVSGYVRVTSATVSVPAGGTGTADAPCPTGTQPLGGGWFQTTAGANLRVIADSVGVTGAGIFGWEVSVVNAGATAASFRAQAVCAHIS